MFGRIVAHSRAASSSASNAASLQAHYFMSGADSGASESCSHLSVKPLGRVTL